MQFYIAGKSHSLYGSYPMLTAISLYLDREVRDCGDAIQGVEIYLHFPDFGPAAPTLDELLQRHIDFRAKLPFIKFYRSKRKIEIAISSDLTDWREYWKLTANLSFFERAFDESLAALSLIRRKIKSSDSFEIEAFLTQCFQARKRIPDSDEGLATLISELFEADKAAREAMSEWEKLDIDWEDYHPQAREILDDPFFWNCTNEFSPHGNDTGADLLAAYGDWLKSRRSEQPLCFLDRLASQWGYADFASIDENFRDDAAIGMAFAEIKLRGKCDNQVRSIAVESIHHLRIRAESAHGWSHRDERLSTLAMLDQKLAEVSNGG